jgi:hypothetical protein
MGFLGRWEIDDLLTFPVNTHSPSTGAATDADSVPTYRVYEDETGTPILTGSMALLDGANTAGFYSEQITLSAANGFETGKSYTIYVSATVGGVVGTMAHTFQVELAPATAASIAALNNLSAAQVNAEADTALADVGLTTTVTGRVDAAVSTRMATFVYTAPDNADIGLIKAKTDNLPNDPADASDVLTAISAIDPPTALDIAAAVWANSTRTLTSFGTLVADVWSAVTRTLTSGGGGLTAQEVWEYVTRTITGGGGSAADIWDYASRTLTQPGVQVTASVTGSNMAIVAATTFSAMITDLDIPQIWTKCYFTIKPNHLLASPDSTAALQIVATNGGDAGDGLLYLQGEAATAGDASLVVDDNAFTVEISISDDATAELMSGNYNYDLKVLLSDDTSVLLLGAQVRVTRTPTNTV